MNDSNIGSFASLAGIPRPEPGPERRIPPTGTRLLLLLSLAACGFPRPADLPGDAAVDTPDPSFVLQVSPSGDDANDGLLQPVKTLKHAIGLAAADARITKVVLASGTYSGSSGETFPYAVASNVVITGPAGGGAILVGDRTAPGVSVNVGVLQNLEFQDFTVAITITGMSTLRNIRISTDTLAVQLESSAVLAIENLEITGVPGTCARGIVLNGAAELTAMTLSTRRLGTSLEAKDQSVVSVSNATAMENQECVQGVLMVSSSRSFGIAGGLIDGGQNGIVLRQQLSSGQLRAQLANVVMRNLKAFSVEGGGVSRNSILFEMTGGELFNTADLIFGTWTLRGVIFRRGGIYLQGGALKLRSSSLVGAGIEVSDDASADLGTGADPGGNLIQATDSSGVTLSGNSGGTLVEAVGNTWNPNVQGSDSAGRYATPAIIVGPVSYSRGNNFTIVNGWGISR